MRRSVRFRVGSLRNLRAPVRHRGRCRPRGSGGIGIGGSSSCGGPCTMPGLPEVSPRTNNTDLLQRETIMCGYILLPVATASSGFPTGDVKVSQSLGRSVQGCPSQLSPPAAKEPAVDPNILSRGPPGLHYADARRSRERARMHIQCSALRACALEP